MFAVRCPSSLLWHPAVHHSLLLLRALGQRHTLLFTDGNTNKNTSSASGITTLCLQSCGQWLTIAPVDSTDSRDGLRLSPSAPHQVHDPCDILHFFSPVSGASARLQAYLDASLVTRSLLAATDGVLTALDMPDAEAMRQAHAHLLDRVAGLDSALVPTRHVDHGRQREKHAGEEDDDDAWATWPLFSTLRFLIECGGLPLGPFPHAAQEYERLCGTSAVRSHDRLVAGTVDTMEAAPAAWERRFFLREVQRQLAAYTEDEAEKMAASAVERGPVRMRESGGRFGLQPLAARQPWTRRSSS